MEPSGRATTQERAELRAVAKGLHRRLDGSAGPALVDLEIDRALGRFARARVRTYVPILVEREVMRRLGRRSPRSDAA